MWIVDARGRAWSLSGRGPLLLPSPGPAWLLTECPQSSSIEVSLDGLVLESALGSEGVVLMLAPGARDLKVCQGVVSSRWRLEVGERDLVLDALRWARLVSSLQERLPPQAMAPSASHWVRAVLAIMPAWSRALSAVSAAPRRSARDVVRLIPVSHLRKVDSGLERWFARHPSARLALHDPDASQRVMDSMTLFSVDHPANRTTALWIDRVVRALMCAEEALVEVSRGGASCVNEPFPLSLRVASRWALAKARSLRRRGPWRSVTPEAPNQETLMALLDDPLYARVHNLSRCMLSPTMMPRWETRAVWRAGRSGAVSLYGVWAFLELCELLKRRFPDWSWRSEGFECLWAEEEGRACFEGVSAEGDSLSLWWRPGFDELGGAPKSPRRDLSGVGGGALALTASFSGASPTWMVLSLEGATGVTGADARRVSHERREGLWWEGFGGRPVGSVWLDGGLGERPLGWGDWDFWHRYGVGWASLVPGEGEGQACLTHWLTALKG